MTPEIIAKNGVQQFQADPPKVFAASLGALKALGYEIAFSDEPTGVIKTAPRAVNSVAHGVTSPYTGEMTAVTTHYTRSYALVVTPDNGQTRVEATPHMFENGADISMQDHWNIASEVNQMWYQLFHEIGSNLAAPTTAPTAPTAPTPIAPPG